MMESQYFLSTLAVKDRPILAYPESVLGDKSPPPSQATYSWSRPAPDPHVPAPPGLYAWSWPHPSLPKRFAGQSDSSTEVVSLKLTKVTISQTVVHRQERVFQDIGHIGLPQYVHVPRITSSSTGPCSVALKSTYILLM